MTDADERRVLIGLALLDGLLDSDLAQADDRRIAARLLRESALSDLGPAAGTTAPPTLRGERAVDDVEFVEDNGGTDESAEEGG